MKLYQILNAIPALNKLSGSDMPLTDAYKIQKLTENLQSDIEFFNERNSKIIQKNNGKIKENGVVEYPEETQKIAQGEFNELLSFDTQAQITSVKIPVNENIKLSANDITVLMPFIEFVH